MLQKGLIEKVEKWNEPKKYATLKFGEIEDEKSFSPDILVDYNIGSNSAVAVLDVKNKRFDISSQKLSEVVEPADIYQLLFYCRSVNSKLGALIYPTNSNFIPVKLMVDSKEDLRLLLISVNMKDSFENRFKQIIKDIKNELLYYA